MKMKKQPIKWGVPVTRPWSPLKHTPWVEYFTTGLTEEVKTSLSSHLLVHRGGNKCTSYFDVEEWEKLSEIMTRLCKNQAYLVEWAKTCRENADSIVKASEEFKKKSLIKKSFNDLSVMFEDYCEPMKKWAFYGWPVLIVERVLETILRERLKEQLFEKNKVAEYDRIFGILSTKSRPNESDEEERDLLMIALRSKKEKLSSTEVGALLQEHSDKYSWYPVYDYTSSPWDIDYFEARIEELVDVADEELRKRKSPEEISSEISCCLDAIEANQDFREFVDIFQEYLYLRTYRTDALRKAYYNTQKFLGHIATRMGWENYLMPYMTHYELSDFLKKEALPRKDEIIDRSKDFLLIMKRGKELEIFADRESIENVKEEELGIEEREVTRLKGMGVYPGVAVGSVRIIENPKQLIKMTDDAVLVSTMTSPDMHAILQKAVAIVTDEGGITCHAAIVSRELGIPCVIATEVATKVLRDGDIVRVDSKEGTVEKLEKT